MKPVEVVTVTFVNVGGRESVVDRGGYVPVVVGQDDCGVCLDGSVSQCGHRARKALILKGFAVVRQVGEAVEHVERYSVG